MRLRNRKIVASLAALFVVAGGTAAFTAGLTGPGTSHFNVACYTPDGRIEPARQAIDRAPVCARPGDLLKQWEIQDFLVPPTSSTTGPTSTTSGPTTTKPPVTTTTVPSGGTIVPAGPACPRSTSASTYEGNTLTQAQAAQAAYQGGFHALADIRAVIGIGRAESSLCVRVWHWHPEQGVGIADKGWLQINNHFWPQFPESQVMNPVGAVQATKVIFGQTNTWNTWDTWAGGQAQGVQPTAATVCAAVPATGC